MAWNKVYPLKTTPVSESPSQIQENFMQIQNWTEVEHVGFASIETCGASAVGLHKADNIGVVGYGNLSTPEVSGALSYDPSRGLFTISASDFSRVDITRYWSQSRALGGNHVIEHNSWTSLYFNAGASGTFDTLGEWDTNKNKFKAKATGHYLISVAVLFPHANNDYNRGLQILKDDIVTTKCFKFGRIFNVVKLVDIGIVTSGSEISAKCYQNSGNQLTIDSCAFYIIRLS